MDGAVTDISDDFQRYSRILSPIFTLRDVDAFEYACAFLRVEFGEGAAWDSLRESREVLEDLTHFNRMDLTQGPFQEAEKTRWRLHLLSYVHLVEMHAPYHLLNNLLRIRSGLKFLVDPFHEREGMERKGAAPGRPSPADRIREIRRLSENSGHSAIGQVFKEFFFPALRNAVAHSDYVLSDKGICLLRDRIPDLKKPGRFLSVIPFPRLETILSRAYDFYSVFFVLEREARLAFGRIQGQRLPWGSEESCRLEFLVDAQGSLCGFKLHRPNGRLSLFHRDEGRCETAGIAEAVDGGISLV